MTMTPEQKESLTLVGPDSWRQELTESSAAKSMFARVSL